MNIAILGIDLGKNPCSVVGVDETGAVVLRRRMRHQTIGQYASGLPRCVIAMEPCCGAHHLGRILPARGHECLDCAGGTGDNPAAPGPAQTGGADPNRLYGDGDGIVLPSVPRSQCRQSYDGWRARAQRDSVEAQRGMHGRSGKIRRRR